MTTLHRIEIPTPFALSRVNCYYLHDSVPTLIDAGVDTDEAFETLRSGIIDSSGSLEGIKRIILTHAHADHIGLLSRIVEVSGAEVFIHQLDAPKMKDSGEQGAAVLRDKYRQFFMESGVPGNITEEFLEVLFKRLKRYFKCFENSVSLTGSEVFSLDDYNLEIIHTPGHSPGSACIFARSEGILFSGDTLLEKITSNPVFEVNPTKETEGYRSLESYKNTLSLLRELPASIVMPGHGKPFLNHLERVDQLLDHHEERTEQILAILRSNQCGDKASREMTRYTMTQRLFDDLKGMDIFLGLSELKGHLEILGAAGRVYSVYENGRQLYGIQN